MIATKLRAESAIHARREQEARLTAISNSLRENANMRRNAEWELKTDRLVVGRLVQDRIAQKRAERDAALEDRRRRLAAKLAREEQALQQELQANLETPEQVREQMASRLAEFKRQRQQEKRAAVEQALEKRTRQDTDELRLADSRFFTQQCALEREQQLRDK